MRWGNWWSISRAMNRWRREVWLCAGGASRDPGGLRCADGRRGRTAGRSGAGADVQLYARKSAEGERGLRNDNGDLVTEASAVKFQNFASRYMVGDPEVMRRDIQELIDRLAPTEIVLRMQLPGILTGRPGTVAPPVREGSDAGVPVRGDRMADWRQGSFTAPASASAAISALAVAQPCQDLRALFADLRGVGDVGGDCGRRGRGPGAWAEAGWSATGAVSVACTCGWASQPGRSITDRRGCCGPSGSPAIRRRSSPGSGAGSCHG